MSRAVDSQTRVFMDERGSILMLVLFMCLAVAVVIQVLSTAVLCAEGAVVDEAEGRARLEEKNAALAALRQGALRAWETEPWATVQEEPNVVEGSVSGLSESTWVMEAAVRQEATVSRLTASAWLERGRDGIDLPLAALVAGSVSMTDGRRVPWLEMDPEQMHLATPDTGGEAGLPGGAVAYLCWLPADLVLLGEACTVERQAGPWELDDGWRQLSGDVPRSSDPESAIAPAGGSVLLAGRPTHVFPMPAEYACREADFPTLVVVTGGADLDARDLGDFYGVIVVDEGSVWLEGTSVHGAIFVSGEVDFGQSGRLLFSRPILRWATDRSLHRVRLVPGSRWEGAE